MPLQKITDRLQNELTELSDSGRAKGAEKVITRARKATANNGPRFLLEGWGDKEFIKMNANSYLGLSLREDMIAAEESAAWEFGVGPGAVRFISGTYQAHIDLEKKLAAFHGREAAMILSSAYVTSMGVIAPLVTDRSYIISDALNHNCIINAIRLSRPAGKAIYQHNDMDDLRQQLQKAVGKAERVIVVTDGIFSMRGDHAPLDQLVDICREFDDRFSEGVISIADDSHGVGAFGPTGRGTEEYCDTRVDILIGTLGKAFGVNGGYVCANSAIIQYLREKAPMYIYSNPITVAESRAALKALQILDGPEGKALLAHLRAMTRKFEQGLVQLGYETIPGEHPVVPLMVRDTTKTADLVAFLTDHGVLATGLNFPVVPKGDEEIRFQVCADHTEADIDYVLGVLAAYKQK